MFITRSMRSWRLSFSDSEVSRPLAAERRHSRIAATKIEAMGSVGRLAMRSNSSSSEPPDQNASSNFRAFERRLRRRMLLSKMIAQLQIEAISSRMITAFTIQSACRNSAQTERSCTGMPGIPEPGTPGTWLTAEGSSAPPLTGATGTAGGGVSWFMSWISFGSTCATLCSVYGDRRANPLGQAGRPPIPGHAGDRDIHGDDQLRPALDALIQRERGAGAFDQPGLYFQFIIEPGGAQIFRAASPYHQHQPVVSDHPRMADARRTQHLGPRALGKLQIVRVVNHPARIGILEIDPNAMAMCSLGPPTHLPPSSASPEAAVRSSSWAWVCDDG